MPQGSASETKGFVKGDCQCPAGSALVERAEDGSYLKEKKCVKCDPGSDGTALHIATTHCSDIATACYSLLPTQNQLKSLRSVGEQEQYLPWQSQREDCWSLPLSLFWAMAVSHALSACIENLMAAATRT